MREYEQIHGYAMATHARAESNSAIIGRTVVTVESSRYHLNFYRGPASLADSIATAGEDEPPISADLVCHRLGIGKRR